MRDTAVAVSSVIKWLQNLAMAQTNKGMFTCLGGVHASGPILYGYCLCVCGVDARQGARCSTLADSTKDRLKKTRYYIKKRKD